MSLNIAPLTPQRGTKNTEKKLKKSPSGGFRGLCGANWISDNILSALTAFYPFFLPGRTGSTKSTFSIV